MSGVITIIVITACLTVVGYCAHHGHRAHEARKFAVAKALYVLATAGAGVALLTLLAWNGRP